MLVAENLPPTGPTLAGRLVLPSFTDVTSNAGSFGVYATPNTAMLLTVIASTNALRIVLMQLRSTGSTAPGCASSRGLVGSKKHTPKAHDADGVSPAPGRRASPSRCHSVHWDAWTSSFPGQHPSAREAKMISGGRVCFVLDIVFRYSLSCPGTPPARVPSPSFCAA